MGDTAIERQPAVIAVVNPVARGVGVGGPSADLQVGGEAGPTVAAERPPELGVVVGDPVGITRPAGPQVVTAVVPDDGELAGGGVKREVGQELAVGSVVVVD